MSLHDIKDTTPNQSAIDLLEKLLKRAKAGEIRSLHYVAQWDNDAVSHGWTLDCRTGRRLMLAEMVMAQHDFTVSLEMREKGSVLYAALGPE